jgi:hypothetical protein
MHCFFCFLSQMDTPPFELISGLAPSSPPSRETRPFDVSSLPLEHSNKVESHVFVEFGAREKPYGLLMEYLAKKDTQSYQLSLSGARTSRKSARGGTEDDTFIDNRKQHTITSECLQKSVGLGFFPFQAEWVDEDGNQKSDDACYLLHQRSTKVVGTDCGAVQKYSAILFGKNIEDLREFLCYLVYLSEKVEGGKINIYRWNVNHEYWQNSKEVTARSLDSVYLQKEVKNGLQEDITEFLSADTKAFYTGHGIPYRRSYLFYGPPGTGKTSCIQALGGHWRRNICFLQPSHPKMSDDTLKEAFERLPGKAIVVLEDIDALFNRDRSGNISRSSITFSGLLNALDGVGKNECGNIVIMTSNHRERLDPALVRHGRVDMHVEFASADKDLASAMFSGFYKGASAELAASFAEKLFACLGGQELAPAALQVSTLLVIFV